MADLSDVEETEDEQVNEDAEDEDKNDEVTEDDETKKSNENSGAPEQVDSDPNDGVTRDLAYYVDKMARERAEKEALKLASAKDNKGVFSDDSETDEMVLASIPTRPEKLRMEEMGDYLLPTLSKSSAYHEDSMNVFRSICYAPNRGLGDVSIVAEFKNLRCVDFGGNFITDVTPFSTLPFLGTLKLYRNRICGSAAVKSKSLRFLDLSSNRIRNVNSCLIPNITRLMLERNKISSLDILTGQELKWIRILELRGNNIKTTAGIRLTFLEELYLAENDIRVLEDLEYCPNLKRLHLRDNQIIEVTGFSRKNAKLEYVNLRNNLVTFIDDAVGVCALPRLRTLVMMDNPVQLERDFRTIMIARIPTLAVLDKKRVRDYDRDWAIMQLLDCLYHEKVELMEAVSDLMNHLHPVESVSGESLSSTTASENSIQESGSEPRTDYVSEGYVNDNLDEVNSLIDATDDDLQRDYYKEPEDEEENADGDEDKQ